MSTNPPPILCPFCGTAIAERLCYGHLHHFRCARCPSASCYEVFAVGPKPVRCKGTTDIPKGERCEGCGGTGIKPPKEEEPTGP